MLSNMIKPYSKLESFMYDKFIAPSVADIYKEYQDKIIELIPKNAKVLDVGCGGGQILFQIASERTDISLTGLDLSHEQIGRAKKRNEKSGNIAEFIQGSALELPFDDNYFDVVYSVGSIKHWPLATKGLKECIRVLKPKGQLLISECNKNCNISDAISFTKKWRTPIIFKPFNTYFYLKYVAERSYTLEETIEMFEKNNIKPIESFNIKNSFAFMIKGIKN